MADPEFFLLHPASFINVSQRAKVLGRMVRNFKQPDTDFVDAQIDLTSDEHASKNIMTDFRVETEKTKEIVLGGKATELAQAEVSRGSSTGSKVSTDRLVFYQLKQPQEEFEKMIGNESTKRKTLQLFKGRRGAAPSMITGIVICESGKVGQFREMSRELRLKTDVPLATFVAGVPLPIADVGFDARAVSTEETAWSGSIEGEKIFALQLPFIKRTYLTKKLNLEDDHPTFDHGRKLAGQESEPSDEDVELEIGGVCWSGDDDSE